MRLNKSSHTVDEMRNRADSAGVVVAGRNIEVVTRVMRDIKKHAPCGRGTLSVGMPC